MQKQEAGAEGEALTGLEVEALWREWRPRAAAYCRAFRGLTAEEREDAASEAVARAWAARERYDPTRPFAPWFLAIVRRTALDAVSRRGEGQAEYVDAIPGGEYGPEAAALRDAEADFVRAFVARLPDRDRELASLHYGQGLGLAEAARVCGMPEGSAKWRLSEIRKALRRAWEREYGSA